VGYQLFNVHLDGTYFVLDTDPGSIRGKGPSLDDVDI